MFDIEESVERFHETVVAGLPNAYGNCSPSFVRELFAELHESLNADGINTVQHTIIPIISCNVEQEATIVHLLRERNSQLKPRSALIDYGLASFFSDPNVMNVRRRSGIVDEVPYAIGFLADNNGQPMTFFNSPDHAIAKSDFSLYADQVYDPEARAETEIVVPTIADVLVFDFFMRMINAKYTAPRGMHVPLFGNRVLSVEDPYSGYPIIGFNSKGEPVITKSSTLQSRCTDVPMWSHIGVAVKGSGSLL